MIGLFSLLVKVDMALAAGPWGRDDRTALGGIVLA
jgi:hypothetical protein